jgi:hypothetical protein
VAAQSLELGDRLPVVLLGIAFSFLLKRQAPEEKSSPAVRLQQVGLLLKRLPELLGSMSQHRRALSLELTRLLRQGPDRYFTSALRELQGLAK